MLDVCDFWLGLGVDGFRVDMIDHLLQEPALRGEALDGTGRHQPAHAHHHPNQPDLADVLRGLCALTDEDPGGVLAPGPVA